MLQTWLRRLVLFAAGLLLLAGMPVAGERHAAPSGQTENAAPAPEPRRTSLTCPLCQAPSGVPIVNLTSADVIAVGRALSAWNEEQIARIDSLYRVGRFGETGSSDARHAAHLLARLSTQNAYTYIVRFASDSTCVYEASESTLVRAFKTFSDPGLYPITRLRRARMGLGHVCLWYDLRRDLDTLAVIGERRVRVRVRDTEIEGERERMLSMMLPTGLDAIVEVLMTEHYSCDIEKVRNPGPPGPVELYVLENMQGFYLRKWGTHRPRALMFWVTPDAGVCNSLPPTPLVGVRIYVPNLRLKLPLLPDLGFDDLREIDLPQPILRLEYVRRESHPEWLDPQKNGGFGGWSGYGPVPDIVRERFPDH